ncbi:MAG: CsiV family protein [Pseudomonadota bacterium]
MQRLSMMPALLLALLSPPTLAQNQAGTWYQVEVSIFAQEGDDVLEERWDLQRERAEQAGMGEHDGMTLRSREAFLSLSDWDLVSPNASGNSDASDASDDEAPQRWLIEPRALDPADINLPNFERDTFVRLPAEDQNFRQTNQALERSPDHRLLWHAAWRQPMERIGDTRFLRIEGGDDADGRPELDGGIRAYFSNDTTRVILDVELWRTMRLDGEWQRLPMDLERAMVSNEFHYLDHPALGIVVEVFRYEPE